MATTYLRTWANWVVVLGFVCATVPEAFAAEPVSASLDPVADARAHVAAGRAAIEAGAVEEACVRFKAAVLQLPSWWVARLEYVKCARLLGLSHDVLLMHVDAALRTDPDKSALYHLRGIVLEDMGDRTGALQSFIRSAELAPWYPDPQLRVGALALQEGNLERARLAFERLVKELPDSLIARNQLAEVYIRLERLPDAVVQLEMVSKRSRYRAAVLARLAKLYAQLKMWKEHRHVIRQLEQF